MSVLVNKTINPFITIPLEIEANIMIHNTQANKILFIIQKDLVYKIKLIIQKYQIDNIHITLVNQILQMKIRLANFVKCHQNDK